jgi:ubiquinone/menaquinone biosynthesis C-methylase UbiE
MPRLSWTGEVVARHQDPAYLERILKRQLFSYFPPSRFAGKRVLDFGCGTGASTFCLARLLPDSQVTGIDFDRSRLEVARGIAELSDWPNASFRLSPTALSLPPDLGTVDFIVMSAAYQHLLPAERRKLMPLLWRLLAPGGALLVSQTPHRWYPVESGVSGLALLNYLPVRIAAFLARHFSSRDEEANRQRDLPEMLRAGLRGGAESEILNLLPANTIVMQPAVQHNRAEYWRESAGERPGMGMARRLATEFFRWTDRRWGAVPASQLDVVIKKWGQ